MVSDVPSDRQMPVRAAYVNLKILCLLCIFVANPFPCFQSVSIRVHPWFFPIRAFAANLPTALFRLCFSRLSGRCCLLALAFFVWCGAGLADLNSTAAWQTRCVRLSDLAVRENRQVIVGDNAWLFPVADLRHIAAGEFWGAAAVKAARDGLPPEAADPLPAILDFHEQLQRLGVNLLVVPVPPKARIFPDVLPAPDGTAGRLPAELPPLPVYAEFYEILRKHDIQALDLTELFWQRRADAKGAPYCRTDSHWSGNGCVLAARAIAEIIGTGAPAGELESAWSEVEIHGDLSRMPGGEGAPPEKIMIRRVGRRVGDTLEPVAPDANSPVILLGDSHNLVFHGGGDMHTTGAGLPDQLALEMGQPVELVAVRGSGATPARVNLYRRAVRNPEYWRNRRWVVWCFAAREFTESDGWRKIPVQPPGKD